MLRMFLSFRKCGTRSKQTEQSCSPTWYARVVHCTRGSGAGRFFCHILKNRSRVRILLDTCFSRRCLPACVCWCCTACNTSAPTAKVGKQALLEPLYFTQRPVCRTAYTMEVRIDRSEQYLVLNVRSTGMSHRKVWWRKGVS